MRCTICWSKLAADWFQILLNLMCSKAYFAPVSRFSTRFRTSRYLNSTSSDLLQQKVNLMLSVLIRLLKVLCPINCVTRDNTLWPGFLHTSSFFESTSISKAYCLKVQKKIIIKKKRKNRNRFLRGSCQQFLVKRNLEKCNEVTCLSLFWFVFVYTWLGKGCPVAKCES